MAGITDAERRRCGDACSRMRHHINRRRPVRFGSKALISRFDRVPVASGQAAMLGYGKHRHGRLLADFRWSLACSFFLTTFGPACSTWRLFRRHQHRLGTMRRCARIRRCARSISGRKWRIRPWIGQAAASPSAQIVWPSICLVTSSSMSISRLCGARRRTMPLHDAPHPARAFAAGRALAAALVLVEVARAARWRLHDVGGLVHDDDGGGAERRICGFAQAVEIHRRSMICSAGDQRHRRAAGDDRQQIVPAAADAAAVLFDQLAER